MYFNGNLNISLWPRTKPKVTVTHICLIRHAFKVITKYSLHYRNVTLCISIPTFFLWWIKFVLHLKTQNVHYIIDQIYKVPCSIVERKKKVVYIFSITLLSINNS